MTLSEKAQENYSYYLYGIVGNDRRQSIDELPGEGIDPAYPVYTLPYQAIQALVSKVLLAEFGQEALETNLNNLEWLEAKVRAHQGILETVLAGQTLIPTRFCTIYRSESRIREILARYHDDFMDTLARLNGKYEWGVKLYCNAQILSQKIEDLSDPVKALKMEIRQKSDGAAYFLKKKLEATLAEEVERTRDECAQKSHECLSCHAAEAVINPLRSREMSGRSEMMLLNGAYLMAKKQLAAFQVEVAGLQEKYGHLGLCYEMTGPWPAYNFVALDLTEESSRSDAHQR